MRGVPAFGRSEIARKDAGFGEIGASEGRIVMRLLIRDAVYGQLYVSLITAPALPRP